MPHTAASVRRVLAALRKVGVSRCPQAIPGSSGLRLGPSLGLVEVQERITRRAIRDVYHRTRTRKRRVAELAVDRVTYRVGGHPLELHEVEIEAKAEGGTADVARIVDALRCRFGAALRAVEVLETRDRRSARPGCSDGRTPGMAHTAGHDQKGGMAQARNAPGTAGLRPHPVPLSTD